MRAPLRFARPCLVERRFPFTPRRVGPKVEADAGGGLLYVGGDRARLAPCLGRVVTAEHHVAAQVLVERVEQVVDHRPLAARLADIAGLPRAAGGLVQ
ncbi:MAG: hypothetical protein MUC89_23800, partial [Acetobacteraceae bacterium]|nr:hypothetical protein [Acetobacteraceae bacterium]